MPLSAGAALEYVSFCDIGIRLGQPSGSQAFLSADTGAEWQLFPWGQWSQIPLPQVFCYLLQFPVSSSFHSHQCKWGGLCRMLFSWQNSLGFWWESLLQSRWGRRVCIKPSGAQSCVPMWEEESRFLKPVVPVQYPRKVSGVCWLFFSAKWLHNCVTL